MKYPSLSQLEPEQIQAIWIAREKGNALFSIWDFVFTIIKSEARGFNVTAMDKEGNHVWFVTDNGGIHYALEVNEWLRWRWIGTVLLRTKEALSWILHHDWSWRYSRILFLIKKWYIPTKKLTHLFDQNLDVDISEDEFELLLSHLKKHVEGRLVWNILPVRRESSSRNIIWKHRF
jgi:hypothetical protein